MRTEISSKNVGLLLAFLDPFNEYDREDRCQVLFGKIDPNSPTEFMELMDREYFLNPWYGNAPANVKRELAQALLAALETDNFDFKWLVEEADGTFGLPSAWHVRDHRQLFEHIYRGVRSHWLEDLESSGLFIPAR